MSEVFERVREKGKLDGIEIGKVEIAKRMFKSNRYAIEDIVFAIGMSETEVKELCNA